VLRFSPFNIKKQANPKVDILAVIVLDTAQLCISIILGFSHLPSCLIVPSWPLSTIIIFVIFTEILANQKGSNPKRHIHMLPHACTAAPNPYIRLGPRVQNYAPTIHFHVYWLTATIYITIARFHLVDMPPSRLAWHPIKPISEARR
jgi:hypothetical protein